MADKHQVSNPAPKDTKTVNDMFGHEKTGTLKQKELKPSLRDSREARMNEDLMDNSVKKNTYNGSNTAKRSKNSLSVKKVRNQNFATNTAVHDNSFTQTKKLKLKVPQNDFDPKTVKDGLDVIDLELDAIDQSILNGDLTGDGNQIEEIVQANKALREKVEQIADLVVSAITKPEDPELNSKLSEIKRYQKEIMIMSKQNKNYKHKYSNISYKYKVKELNDEVKSLQTEIEKLEKERDVIHKENQDREHKSIKIIQNDQGHEERIGGLKDNLRAVKEQISELVETKKTLDDEYEAAMVELRKADGEFRSLREKKIVLNSNKPQTIESDFEKGDELMAELQKKKILKKIADSKATQIKTQITAQKKINSELDREIEEMKEAIQAKLDQNEKMSIRAKELKGMIADRKVSGNRTQIKVPVSPVLSDVDKSEL